MINVYLSGPMYLGEAQAKGWREYLKLTVKEKSLNKRYFFYDPCSRFYDDKTFLQQNASWIVKLDKMEIEKSHIVVVNACEKAWGTPMEQYIAYSTGKFVIAFSDDEHPSIWAKEHCHVFLKNVDEVAEFLLKNAMMIERITDALH
jgi:nucleoside 2-deoxyribosyltransferase